MRRWMSEEPRAFFDELRRNRPVLATPEVTLAVRFSDCRDILLRHDVFSVALYKPKQGDYLSLDGARRHRRALARQRIMDHAGGSSIARTFYRQEFKDLCWRTRRLR